MPVKKNALHIERQFEMDDKKLYISRLYDYYGQLLTEKQRFAVELYYYDDLSLSEISEQVGITRQGVRDQLKHAEDYLVECEEKLGFAKKLSRAANLADEICDKCKKQDCSDIISIAKEISDILS